MATIEELRSTADERNIRFGDEKSEQQCLALAEEFSLDLDSLLDLAESVIDTNSKDAVISAALVDRMRTEQAREMEQVQRGRPGMPSGNATGTPGNPSKRAPATALEATFQLETKIAPPTPRTGAWGASPGIPSARQKRTPPPAHSTPPAKSARFGALSTPHSSVMSTPHSPAMSTPHSSAVAGLEEEADVSCSGDVVASYEGAAYEDAASGQFDARSALDTNGVVAVKPLGKDDALFGDGNVMEPFKFMFTPLEVRAATLNQRTESLSDAMARDGEEFAPVNMTSQMPFLTVGRVSCDAEGRLNPKSIQLQGCLRVSNAARVALDMSEAPQYSLCPGATVALRGMNALGSRFVVQEVTHGSPLPAARSPVATLQAQAAEGGAPLRVWTARGPYTYNDDLEFKPLSNLILEVEQADNPPDVLVLMGPFLDESHPMLQAGAVRLADEEGVVFSLSLREVWDLKVMTMLAHLLAVAPTSHMRVVLLPSCSDVVLPSVFPQPPMSTDALRGIPEDARHRITVVSNPGTFSMGGVVFGAVTEDILMHMAGDSAQHVPSLPPTSRIPRLAQHLLDQRSYYPLFPAPATVPVDLAKMGHLDLPLTPDVLLVPSCLKTFAQQIGSTLVVNPGILTKMSRGGTFGKISIAPLQESNIRPDESEGPGGDEAQSAPHQVPERAQVEVVRI